MQILFRRRFILLILILLFFTGCNIKLVGISENFARQLSNYEIGKQSFDSEDPLLKKRMILISGGINDSKLQAISQKLIFLDRKSPSKPIQLLINSGGGNSTSYLSVSNMIKSIKSPVNTVNIGLCGSSAAMLIQSATGKRYAVKDTAFIIHNPKGKPHDLLKMYVKLQEKLYEECCELPKEWFPLKDKEYTFSAEQAKEYNFVDEVIDRIGACGNPK
jgi:ATP-dependent Clp protease protease subunit